MMQIHWFSIFNSFMMVIFLTGLVSMILMRTLRNDYAKYAREDDDLETLVMKLYTATSFIFNNPLLNLLILLFSGKRREWRIWLETCSWWCFPPTSQFGVAVSCCGDRCPIRTINPSCHLACNYWHVVCRVCCMLILLSHFSYINLLSCNIFVYFY